MTILVLFILALMWAIVLVPPWLRNRGEVHGRRNSVKSFNKQMRVLANSRPTVIEPATRMNNRLPYGSSMLPAATVVPDLDEGEPTRTGASMTPADAARRRRDIVRLLIAGMAITLVSWFISGSIVVLSLHFVLDVSFLVYVGLLARLRRAEAERAAKVRYLPQRSAAPQPALLRRTSS